MDILEKILNVLSSGVEQGIIWAILVIGVYISYRVLDIADLSIEGTFPLGASVCALMIFYGMNPFIASILALFAGMIGGMVTGLLHTKLKIPAILSGIITMTALITINLVILGFSSEESSIKSLLNINTTVYDGFTNMLIKTFNMVREGADKTSKIFISLLFLAGTSALIYWLFGTEIGMNLRATGNNPKMARAQGINTDLMVIIGLMLSNGLIALSGALFAQSSGTAMTESGRGTIVIGLASIIIGEIIFGKRSFKRSLISIIIGSVIFFIIKATAIKMNVDYYLDFLTAVLIAVILAMPYLKSKVNIKKKGEEHA